MEGIYIILMGSEVTKICSLGEAESSPIQLIEEISEIPESVSAARRITPVFKKLKLSGDSQGFDLLHLQRKIIQFFVCFDMAVFSKLFHTDQHSKSERKRGRSEEQGLNT